MYPYRLYMVIDLEEPKHYYPRQSAAQAAKVLTEILKDGPILRWATKSNVTDKAAVAMDEMDGEDGGDFEGVWLGAKRLAALALQKARDSNMWPVKICNLLRNLHYLHSPEIGKVIYIIIYIAGVLYATLAEKLSPLFSPSFALFSETFTLHYSPQKKKKKILPSISLTRPPIPSK